MISTSLGKHAAPLGVIPSRHRRRTGGLEGPSTDPRIEQHIEVMKGYFEPAGGTSPQIASHPIAFGSGEWPSVELTIVDGRT
jgi:hypothetical protein